MSESRRGFLRSTAALGAALGAPPGRAVLDDFVTHVQTKPEPRVALPTDALPAPAGPKKRIAAIASAYFKYSHADDIITKFIEGYAIAERVHQPHCEVVSLRIEQFPETDIGRGMAARYGLRLASSVADALTLGTGELAVDGVLIIAEHGDYPFNAREQHLYPRRRLFAEAVAVFRGSGRGVPVYLDKHFSYDWLSSKWMYEQSQDLGFPMMAGSSVPVAWRHPALAFRPGIALDSALALGFSGVEVYGFHALELLQAFVEKRRGGETGVAAVQCLEGPACWDAARDGRWPVRLLESALAKVPGGHRGPPAREHDPGAVAFVVDYADGFRGTAFLARRLASEFGFAAAVAGRAEPVACWCELNKPQRDHFSFLCNHIEVMFRGGRSSYPVERTYLVTGALDALMASRAEGGRQIPTPHLRTIGYQPAPDFSVG